MPKFKFNLIPKIGAESHVRICLARNMGRVELMNPHAFHVFNILKTFEKTIQSPEYVKWGEMR